MNKSKKKGITNELKLLSSDHRLMLCTALSLSEVSVIFISSFYVLNVTSTIQSPHLNSRALQKVQP